MSNLPHDQVCISSVTRLDKKKTVFGGAIIHGTGDTFHVIVYDKNSTLANNHLALLGRDQFLNKTRTINPSNMTPSNGE